MLPQLEALESKALELLMKEPEASRPALIEYAKTQLEAIGLDPHLSSDRPNQAVHDLLGSNLALPDWLRARGVSVENALQAEDFEDLIDRLTPAYQDN